MLLSQLLAPAPTNRKGHRIQEARAQRQARKQHINEVNATSNWMAKENKTTERWGNAPYYRRLSLYKVKTRLDNVASLMKG